MHAFHRRGFLLGASALAACSGGTQAQAADAYSDSSWRKLTDAQWKSRLSPAAYQVLRREGTERAGSSPLDREKRQGTFVCAGCELPPFKSDWKYDSGTGWPSFWQAEDNAVRTKEDRSLFSVRTEVHCRRCGGHFGHIFDDGPPPTGKRHCINGFALTFKPVEAA